MKIISENDIYIYTYIHIYIYIYISQHGHSAEAAQEGAAALHDYKWY